MESTSQEAQPRNLRLDRPPSQQVDRAPVDLNMSNQRPTAITLFLLFLVFGSLLLHKGYLIKGEVHGSRFFKEVLALMIWLPILGGL